MNFSFKREPIWILVFSIAPAAVSLLILAILLIARAVR
jgi:hypothetical protein